MFDVNVAKKHYRDWKKLYRKLVITAKSMRNSKYHKKILNDAMLCRTQMIWWRKYIY